MNNFRLITSWALLILLTARCRQINQVFNHESPREVYKNKIRESPLASKPMVKRWVASGDSVLRQPIARALPFQTNVLYFNDEANARAWQFSLKEGRSIRIHLSKLVSTHRIFFDLFALSKDGPSLVKSTEDTSLTFTADKDGSFVLRLQPELLVDGSATFTLTDHPSLAFPVQGGSPADIGGVFGDPRDGGARKHKGNDIFADRGTPVVAVADGRVSRTGNHGLGGKQVWLRAGGKSMYYAHLDSINSRTGERVQAGDTLGFVGNTGNARHSPPHLHFGIYAHGAIDPLPFIDFAQTKVKPMTTKLNNFKKWGRVSAAKANVRPLPSTQKSPIKSLAKGTAVQVTGGTGNWYHIMLPDQTSGFIYQTLIEPASESLRTQKVQSSNQLFAIFQDQAPSFLVDSLESIQVFGIYKNRLLAQYKNHWLWVENNYNTELH